MRINWKVEWPHLGILVAMFALTAWAWPGAPDQMPTHYGLDGKADGWGGKFAGLGLLPFIALATYVMMLLVPRLDPGYANYESFPGPFATIRLSILVLMAIVQFATIFARGRELNTNMLVPFAFGVMLVMIGNQFGKIRPNWFVGFRTPWTLSSKVAWTRTHRAAGWLLVVTGVMLIAGGAFGVAWLVYGAVGISVAGILALTAWSYRLWRDDPDKTPPAGTLPGREG